jgi:hypothetical protein
MTVGSALLTRKEASKYLAQLGYSIAPSSLKTYASREKGPPYYKVNGYCVRYSREDLEKWLQSITKRVE